MQHKRQENMTLQSCQAAFWKDSVGAQVRSGEAVNTYALDQLPPCTTVSLLDL